MMPGMCLYFHLPFWPHFIASGSCIFFIKTNVLTHFANIVWFLSALVLTCTNLTPQCTQLQFLFIHFYFFWLIDMFLFLYLLVFNYTNLAPQLQHMLSILTYVNPLQDYILVCRRITTKLAGPSPLPHLHWWQDLLLVLLILTLLIYCSFLQP